MFRYYDHPQGAILSLLKSQGKYSSLRMILGLKRIGVILVFCCETFI